MDIGVIGGADGPTAIYVTSLFRPSPWVIAGVVVVIAAAIGYRIWKKKRQSKP